MHVHRGLEPIPADTGAKQGTTQDGVQNIAGVQCHALHLENMGCAGKKKQKKTHTMFIFYMAMNGNMQ